MRARLKALFAKLGDTLAKRLLWLMWVTLVLSHLLAFGLFVATRGDLPGGPPPRPDAMGADAGPGPGWPPPQGQASRPPLGARLPVLPSLPPMGLGDGPRRAPGLSTPALLLDYAVRLLVIALGAWAGARWLTRPLRRLVQATRGLADAIRRGTPPPRLDEQAGTREVQALAQEFNQMSTQLQRQFESRALMVAAISHDLRTPLTRLRMRLETIDDPQLLRERAVVDLREMNDLIDSVLQVFRPQLESAEPLQTLELGALVQALVDDRVEVGEAVDLAPGGGLIVRARPLALRRVLDNLVGNALRYGRCARLQIDAAARSLHLDDEGPGIPAAMLEAVFEPFVRVEASRHRSSGGTGLGLYIARELCEGMGVGLTLHNRPEGGLRATLSFFTSSA